MGTGRFGKLWTDIEEIGDLELFRRIKASCGSVEDFSPEPAITSALSGYPRGSTVLDFGCGVGRNTVAIAEAVGGASVLGYDNVEMLSRARAYIDAAGHRDVGLFFEWSLMRAANYDLIVASLVFQHMDLQDLRRTLRAMLKMLRVRDGKLLVLSRAQSDAKFNVLNQILHVGFRRDGDIDNDPSGSCHEGHWVGSFKS